MNLVITLRIYKNKLTFTNIYLAVSDIMNIQGFFLFHSLTLFPVRLLTDPKGNYNLELTMYKEDYVKLSLFFYKVWERLTKHTFFTLIDICFLFKESSPSVKKILSPSQKGLVYNWPCSSREEIENVKILHTDWQMDDGQQIIRKAQLNL